MSSSPASYLPPSSYPPTSRQPLDTPVAAILAATSPLPPRLLSGAPCDVVCEFCPLRAWKSPSLTAVHCRQVLAKARAQHKQTARG